MALPSKRRHTSVACHLELLGSRLSITRDLHACVGSGIVLLFVDAGIQLVLTCAIALRRTNTSLRRVITSPRISASREGCTLLYTFLTNAPRKSRLNSYSYSIIEQCLETTHLFLVLEPHLNSEYMKLIVARCERHHRMGHHKCTY